MLVCEHSNSLENVSKSVLAHKAFVEPRPSSTPRHGSAGPGSSSAGGWATCAEGVRLSIESFEVCGLFGRKLLLRRPRVSSGKMRDTPPLLTRPGWADRRPKPSFELRPACCMRLS